MLTSSFRFLAVRVSAYNCATAPSSYVLRGFVSAAGAIPSPSKVHVSGLEEYKPFELYKQPHIEVPSFDIHRRVGNVFSQFLYKYACEREYSLDGLLNGATQAAIVCAKHIYDANWERLKVIMVESTAEEVRERVQTMTKEEVSRMQFTEDDVICSFLHLSCFAGRSFFAATDPKNYSFFTHVVLYVRKDERISLDESPKKLLRKSPAGSIQIVNITLSRTVNPLGLWKVLKINFFDHSAKPVTGDVGAFR